MKLNKKKGWVGLNGLEIKASIGVYDNEKKNGSTLVANVGVFGDLGPAINSDSLKNSLNYEVLAEIVSEEIKSGNHLLEPVANNILVRILEELPLAIKAKISLRKMNPPLDNPCEFSEVKMKMTKKQLKKSQGT